jgi:hypothetical protein
MEYLIIAAGAVFLCLGCFFAGVKIGKSLREVNTIERIIESGTVTLQKTVDTMEKPKLTRRDDGEITPEQAAQNWQEYSRE